MLRPLKGVACGLLLLGFAPALVAGQVSQSQPRPIPKEQQPPPANPIPGKMVVTVNGEPIAESEVQAQLRVQAQGQTLSDRATQQLRSQVINNLIEGRLVEQYVLKNGPQVSAKEVQAMLDQFEKQLQDQGVELSRFLKQRGQTRASFQKRVTGALTWRKYMDEQITEPKLREYFESRKVQFDGTEVHTRHILIKVDASSSETPGQEARQAALEKARKLRQAIEQGLEFSQAAEQYSDDPTSAASGGDLGDISRRGDMIEPIAKTAFTLEAGQVSEPVESSYGVHLVQSVERKEGQKTFADVKNAVAQAYAAELWNRIVAEMSDKSDVQFGGS